MGSSWRAWLLTGMLVSCSGRQFESGPSEPGQGGGASGGPSAGPSEGGAGGKADGGEAPSDHPGASPSAGAGGEAPMGQGGDGGTSQPSCETACGEGRECVATATGPECRCGDGLVEESDDGCRLPRSCKELHAYAPSLPSGPYELKPDGVDESFRAHCGMMQEGGGWTLAVNEGPAFDPTTSGVADSLCYASSCANIAYSRVPLELDVMLDVSNSPIVSTTYTARLIVTGVHERSRGKTLRTLFTTGPNFVEAENNGNLAVRLRDGGKCEDLPIEFAKAVCPACDAAGCAGPVLVFGDGDSDPDCDPSAEPRLAIGAALSYTTSWNNCAGWPQNPKFSDVDYYPDYVRVWVR
jgi:hypothetical protein